MFGNSRNNIWLIRTGGTVKGPYSKNEVESQLSSRELVVIDEICEPMGNWKPIRDKIEFAKIVEVLRLKTLEASENESTFGLDDSHTQNIFEDEASDVDNEITDPNFKVQPPPLKSYGVNASKEALTMASKKQSKALRFVFLVIFTIIGYFIFNQFYTSQRKKILSAEKYIEIANQHLKTGSYTLALNNYKEAYELEPNNLSTHLNLGILYIQKEQNYLLGRRLLAHLIEKKGPFIKLAETGVGLSYLQETDYENAESHFNKAIALDRNYTPAYANLGVVKFYEEKYFEAKEYFTAAIEDGEIDFGVRLMLALSYLNIWVSNPQLQYLVEAQKTIIKNTEVQNPYLQQSLIIQIFIESVLGDRGVTDNEVKKVLNVSPTFTDDFVINLFIDRKIVQWDSIVDWCDRLIERTQGEYTKALRAYCLIKIDDKKTALNILETELLRTPEDSIYLSLYSYALYVSGRQSEAKVSSERAISGGVKGSALLSYLMRAKFCAISQDKKCETQCYGDALKISPKNLVAMTGMARHYWRSNELESARSYYKKSIEISRDYMPLLKLAREITFE